MNDLPFDLHRRALTGYTVLKPAEREAITAALAPLAELPEERWPEAGAVRLACEEPLYFVRVDDSLRAIIRPAAGGRPQVQDFVRHETLQLFRDEADSSVVPT
jgi:hypothetical protein